MLNPNNNRLILHLNLFLNLEISIPTIRNYNSQNQKINFHDWKT